MKITKFKKTGKGKYKLYLENGETVSLYEDVIVNNKLILTKEIDDELMNSIVKENNDIYVYGMAINYISIRMRSKKEIEDYLIKKGISKELIDITMLKLEKDGYINDFAFAKAYANDQFVLSNSGPLKMKRELQKYGIDDEVINEIIDDIDDAIIKEKLNNLIDKQIKIRKGSNNMLKLKLLNYFYNIGYDKEMILSVLNGKKMKVDINHLKKEYNKLYVRYSKKYSGNELNLFIIQKLYSKGYSMEEINKIKNED